MDCVRGVFFWGGGVKVSHTQNTDKNMYIRDFNFSKNHYTSLKTTLCNQGAYIKYMNYTKTSGDARYRLSQNKANVLNLK